MSKTLLAPDPGSPGATLLEFDELWSFVFKRADKRWIWIALSRATRQVVAYLIGDRREPTCQKLWETIPLGYRTGPCYSDFWNAYQQAIPAESHTAGGQESGQTAHVERWNNTLRQRLARFVRNPCPFPNPRSCTKFVCASSFIAITSHSSHPIEPLPKNLTVVL